MIEVNQFSIILTIWISNRRYKYIANISTFLLFRSFITISQKKKKKLYYKTLTNLMLE